MEPLRFIPANDVLPDTLSTFPSSRGFFKDRLQYWQAKQFYNQKWNSEDTIIAYFDSPSTEVNLHALDAQGNYVDLFAGGGFGLGLTWTVNDGANTFDNGGGAEQYYTYYVPILPSSYAIPDGVYFFVLEHVYSGARYYEVSEPIHIRAAKWEKTRLIEYTNNRNELVMDYILWEQVAAAISDPLVFSLRVEGHVDDGEPASADTQFIDMGEQVINLQSHPYQVYNFNIGASGGVPSWLLNKAAAALSCTSVSIDDHDFVKDQGATFAVKKFDTSGLRGATVKLRDADPQEMGVVRFGVSVLLMELLGDGGDPELPFFPCAWNCLSVIDTVLSNTGTSPAKVFDSISELDGYIAAINTDLRTEFSAGGAMRGSISRVGLKIYYNNGIGEHYIKWTSAHCYTYNAFEGMFDTTVKATSSRTFAATLSATTGGGTRTLNAIVDYGDGTVTALTRAAGPVSIGHTFAANGDYNVRIFHGASDTNALEAIGGMQFGQLFPAPDTNVNRILSGSHTPQGLESFQMFNASNGLGTGGGTPNTIFLNDCLLTLNTLLIFDTTVSNFTNDIFDPLTFSALNAVNLLLGIDTTEVNAIVNAFAAYVTYSSMTGGQFLVTNGGTAPPTGAALTFLDVTLAGLPCTVTHD
jgi:hypothetical protein